MADPDDIRAGLRDAAASIDVGDLDDARTDVQGIVRRRRLRNRVGAGLGVVALVVGGTVAFAALDRSDDPDMLASTDATIPPDDTVTDSTQAPVPPPTAAVIEAPRVPGVAVEAPSETQFAFPWRDGFVAGSVVIPPQPLPAEFPPEIAALFPQEVIDLFAVDRPATIAEATEVLSEAGLLDEVSAVLSAHPEASAAVYGEPTSDPPILDARFTTDGTTWESIEMTLPPGAAYFDGVATGGDRLAVLFNELQTPRDPGTAVVTVATTRDLVNWTTQEVAPPVLPVELPAGIQRRVSGQGLVANDSNWAISVFDAVDVDVLQLVPDDVRATLEASNGGFGASSDSSGITIDYAGDVTLDFGETLRYTWEELGVPAEVVPYITDTGYRPHVWAATWDGEPVRSDLVNDSGQMLATPSGFLQWTGATLFSPDGLTWTSGALPEPAGNVVAGFAVDGGVIAVSVSPDDGSMELYRLDETGKSPQLLDVPGLPSVFQSGFFTQWAPGSAVIVDAAVQTGVIGESEEYVFDLWLVASTDGEEVVAIDLDDADSYGGPTGVVTNRNVALVQAGGTGWQTFTLP